MSRFFPVFRSGTHSMRLADRSISKAHFVGVVSVLDGISITGPLLPPDVKELCRDLYGDLKNNKNAKIQRSPGHFIF